MFKNKTLWGLACLNLFFLSTGVSISLAQVVFDPDSVAIINQISIEGNRRTLDRVILRELSVKPGDTISIADLATQLETERRKIFNINLFITVDITPRFLPDSTHADILISVKERWYFIVFPVFQLADRNFNEWWYDRNKDLRRTIYGAYLSFSNLTGRRDKIRMLAEFGFIPKFEISYSLPYIDKSMKNGVSVGTGYLTNKTMAFRTWNDKLEYLNSEKNNRRRFYSYVNFTHRNKFYASHSVDLRWSRAVISDTIASLNPNYFLDGHKKQSYFQLSYTYTFDRRDNFLYPLRGRLLVIQGSQLGLLSSDDIHQSNLYLWYTHYFPLGKKWFANSGLKTKWSAPSRQPYYQTVGLGFRQTLVRGYELYVIDGQNYALLQNELKYKIFDIQRTFKWIPVKQFNTIPLAAYLNTYADAGYVGNKYPELSRTHLGNRPLYGAGAGLDFVTFYNTIITFNYTVNSLSERRFFFNLSRDF